MGKIDYSMIGRVFGHLTVLELDHINDRGVSQWRCRCECGNEKVVPIDRLKSGNTKSCGCLWHVRTRENLNGRRFGRLYVLKLDREVRGDDAYWLCKCDCGNETVVRGANLKRGVTTSCGCRKRERRTEELTGKCFGRLVVLRYDHTNRNGKSYWLCECDCGNVTIVERRSLLNGYTMSCGCKALEGSKPIDLTGKRFGNLYVLSLDRNDRRLGKLWLCECDCRTISVFRTRELIDGSVTSCGCEKNESLIRDGDIYNSLYVIWTNMKQRCNSPMSCAYERYGGRGIRVCDDWLRFEGFRDWALRNGYEKGLTIDRIDNDDGYHPDNCRWVNYIVQNNNKRNNHYVTYRGDTHTVAEWARLMNIPYGKLLRHVNRGDMSDFEEYFTEE